MSENSVTIKEYYLPETLPELSKFVLIGREKLVAVRAEIRAIDKVGLAEEVRVQKLKEAQDISEAVLDAEVRIGELMAKIPKAKENQYTKMQNDSDVAKQKKKAEIIEQAGFTKKQAERFQTLAKHPDIVEKAKAEARENDDIVSRSHALSMIKAETKKQERQERIEQQLSSPRSGSYADIYNTDKKYRVIYADPPWSYNDKMDTHKLGGAVKHYPTMPLQDICELPIKAEKNSVLFLWTTSPMLEDAFKVINAWGFKYKSSFIWDKVKHSMGHYNSVRHELLLIATKGSCTPDVPKLLDSVVSVERTEHSVKPAVFREIIDELYPNGERLEMFARESAPGWDVWGNMA